MKWIKWFLGGGMRRYRVRGCRVEMKGGGCGPFWGFSHMHTFGSPERAEFMARKWASQEGGKFVK